MAELFNTILYQPLYNLLILLAGFVPGHSIGIAIVLLTIIIRLILLPNSLKAARLQVKNMALQPEINRIRSEIKDKQEQLKATMELYKKEGASPLGSCLPLLIQLPILAAVYKVFRMGLGNSEAYSLYSFVPHIDNLNVFFLGFDLNAVDPWVLPILAALLQFGFSMMMTPKQPKTQAKNTNDPMAMMSKQMLYFPAIITLFFGKTMPAGLVIYWIVTTVFSIGQQWYINKEIKNEASLEKLEKEKVVLADVTEEKKSREEKPQTKKDLMAKIIDKRLNSKAKKSGVNVTVRTKK